MSLATADLLFCVAVMPLMALRYGRRRWPFVSDSLWCRLFPVALYGTVATSVLSLVALTVNRYVLIVHPAWYGAVYRTAGMVPLQLAICWAIPYGLMVSWIELQPGVRACIPNVFFKLLLSIARLCHCLNCGVG